MQDSIIKEVSQEFGLTYNQGKELFDQYWMEYVAKNLRFHKFENIYVQGLGMFSARKANFDALIRDHELGKISAPDWLYQASKKMVENIEKSNSKRKNKKYYG